MDSKGSDDPDVKVVTKGVASKHQQSAAGNIGDKRSSHEAQQPGKGDKKKSAKAERGNKGQEKTEPVNVDHVSALEGLPKKTLFKSTFNTHDIMHAPAEKTIQMLNKILSGERLFTM